MSRRKSFLKRRAPHEEMSLQITSMADIFMILLVFLLKSLSSGTIQIAPSKGLQLPISAGQRLDRGSSSRSNVQFSFRRKDYGSIGCRSHSRHRI
jgi:hypothetical protein